MKTLRTIISTAVLITMLSTMQAEVQAAPASQNCLPGAQQQHDMAGQYRSTTMTLTVYPCGGILVEWTNQYGFHTAAYQTVGRAPGEGVVARVMVESSERLDTSNVLAVKAAEPGFVQVFTISSFDRLERQYRLQKVR